MPSFVPNCADEFFMAVPCFVSSFLELCRVLCISNSSGSINSSSGSNGSGCGSSSLSSSDSS